jgi:hypothetical protein
MGLLVIIAVYVVLGFLLAWIANMVAQEDISVGTGVLTLICAGVVNFFIELGLDQVLDDGIGKLLLLLLIQFFVFAACIKALAKLGWKHSFIIAAIYDGLLFVVGLGLASCAG